MWFAYVFGHCRSLRPLHSGFMPERSVAGGCQATDATVYQASAVSHFIRLVHVPMVPALGWRRYRSRGRVASLCALELPPSATGAVNPVLRSRHWNAGGRVRMGRLYGSTGMWPAAGDTGLGRDAETKTPRAEARGVGRKRFSAMRDQRPRALLTASFALLSPSAVFTGPVWYVPPCANQRSSSSGCSLTSFWPASA